MRLFVTIGLLEATQDHLAEAIDELAVIRTGARVPARALWHVTLAFLGDLPDDRLDAAVTALDTGVAGQSPPVLRIAGGGRFGRGKFTVLWAGVQGDLQPLRRSVTRELKRARPPYDAKRFHPHPTIARPGDPAPG